MDDTIELTNEVGNTKKGWPNLLSKLVIVGLILYAGKLGQDVVEQRWKAFRASIVKEELNNIGNADLTFDKNGNKKKLRDADYKQAQSMMLMLMNERDVCLNRVEGIKSALEYGY